MFFFSCFLHTDLWIDELFTYINCTVFKHVSDFDFEFTTMLSVFETWFMAFACELQWKAKILWTQALYLSDDTVLFVIFFLRIVYKSTLAPLSVRININLASFQAKISKKTHTISIELTIKNQSISFAHPQTLYEREKFSFRFLRMFL